MAPTGRGKTVGLIIYLLDYLSTNNQSLAFFLLPTKELINQVFKTFQQLNHAGLIITKLGSETKLTQLIQARVIIGTPQKITTYQTRFNKNVVYKHQILVLDEVDGLIELGFLEDVKQFIKNQKRYLVKKIAASATIRKGLIYQLKTLFKQPKILLDQSPKINQPDHYFLLVRPETKLTSLITILKQTQNHGGTIVFVNTKNVLFELETTLQQQTNLKIITFHGDLTTNERNRLMSLIKHDQQVIILATDLLARGISLKNLQTVINYQLPKEAIWYTHRSGRTGRYQQPGTVITLVNNSQLGDLKNLAKNGITFQEMKLKGDQLVFKTKQPIRHQPQHNPELAAAIKKIRVQSPKVVKPNYQKNLKAKIAKTKQQFKRKIIEQKIQKQLLTKWKNASSKKSRTISKKSRFN